MTNTPHRVFIVLVTFILLSSGVGLAHNLELITSDNQYIEGWGSESLAPYDVDADPDQNALTIINDTNNDTFLRFESSADDNVDSTVTLNLTNEQVFPEHQSVNMTGEFRLRVQSEDVQGFGSRNRNSIVLVNETGSEIRIGVQIGDGSNTDGYYGIFGGGTDGATRVQSRYEGVNTNVVTDDNFSIYFDLSKNEVGVKTDKDNEGWLTANIKPSWKADLDTMKLRYRHNYAETSSPGPNTDVSFYYWNLTGVDYGQIYTVNGTIKDPSGNPIENANVTSTTGLDVTTGANGFYEFNAPNGTYGVSASANGFVDRDTTVIVAGSNVTHNITLQTETELRLDVNPWMDHGSTQPYEVWEVFENKSDVEVTENATVTSGNVSVITVNGSANLLEATGDLSVAEEVEITAVYNNSTDVQNVTVANLTVENIDILPPWRRLAALIGDVDNVGGTQKTFLWLIIVMLASVVATHYTSAFGGLSTGVVLLTFGWVPGWVSTGVVLIGLFTGMFLAFNVAMNIDYTVMRNRP